MRSWTTHEIAELKRLSREGLPLREIAVRLERTHRTGLNLAAVIISELVRRVPQVVVDVVHARRGARAHPESFRPVGVHVRAAGKSRRRHRDEYYRCQSRHPQFPHLFPLSKTVHSKTDARMNEKLIPCGGA